jgi:erythromycin esterase-like protein
VPLIGEQGWSEDGRRSASNHVPGQARERTLPEMIAGAAEALPELSDPAFARLFDRYASRRVILLSEASHGTSEFYRARAAITRRLIEEHGFTIVAVEADWPDAAAVDRFVRHRDARSSIELPFQRFPTWMWRNTDVDAFVDWLRTYNERIESERRAGFYGLDLYSMSGSIAAVLDYLDKVDPDAATIARERYGCLTPWQKDPSTYGHAVLTDRNGDMEIKRVRPSHRDSYERLCHDADVPRFLVDFGGHEALRRGLLESRLERFIGVIYLPETELTSHYAQASLPRQFDAFVWFDETNAVTPLGPQHARPGVPDTYPFGL